MLLVYIYIFVSKVQDKRHAYQCTMPIQLMLELRVNRIVVGVVVAEISKGNSLHKQQTYGTS